NYKEVEEWLNVMASTTIISEGVVYFAGTKKWAKDRFHVFDRAVSFGKEIEPGQVADKNYVWFSEWQLENINKNYLLPIDLKSYKVIFYHGEKFHRDLKSRQVQKEQITGTPEQPASLPSAEPAAASAEKGIDPLLVSEMNKRAIPEKMARKLLEHLTPDQ